METALATISDPKALKLYTTAATRIGKLAAEPAKAAGLKVLASLVSYQGYLAETNERVSTFRSFANPSVPVSLLDHFVTMELILGKDKKINQDVLLERIHNSARIVVSATAGHGKSMLMRFIALSMYENPRGRIPLFIELRDLNRVSTPDILTYIHVVYRKTSRVGAESLKKALNAGVFCLILDGFDELNHEIRGNVEEQILTISRDYPEISIVISGRPDDKFASWRAFHHYKVAPMSSPRVIELIDKLEYDRGTKKRFIKKIRGGLFKSHESFLSTPLLAILMLLTFEENANIPDKMHLFYSKAFDTLFHKHDATKEQYDRKRRAGLQIDDFAKIFSIFCLNTYVKERVEFNKAELLFFIKNATAYMGISPNAEFVLYDLEEAVCLLQKEGLSYFFVHRSFQEYFTALFLSNCPPATRDDFLTNVTFRYWDTVLPMLFDMASDQLEPSWIAQNVDRYLEFIHGSSNKDFAILTARYLGLTYVKSDKNYEVSHVPPGEWGRMINIMHRFYRNKFPPERIDYRYMIDIGEKLRKARAADKVVEMKTTEVDYIFHDFNFLEGDLIEFDLQPLLQTAKAEYEIIKGIRGQIDISQAQRDNFLNRLFDPLGSD